MKIWYKGKKRGWGFTLIELLVVIAVLGVLASGLFVTINPVEQLKKSRDAGRKSDLAQIQKALETYNIDNHSYPVGIPFGLSWEPYMAKVPQDPRGESSAYQYQLDSSGGYKLYAKLERCSDSQVINVEECNRDPEGYNYGVVSANLTPAPYVSMTPALIPTATITSTPGPTATPTPTPTITPTPNPNPVLVGTVGTHLGPNAVFVSGNYAYVVNNGASTLQKFDISANTPLLVGSVTTGGGPLAVFVSGNYAYVTCSDTNTMCLINKPFSSLEKYDVTGNTPVFVGSVGVGTVSGPNTYPHSISISGNYAYVVNLNINNLLKFDITGSTPVLVTSVNPGGGASIFSSGNYAYVVNANQSLYKFDITNNTPVMVGSVATGFLPYSVSVSGNYAYVVNFSSRTLQKFDISANTPLLVGSATTGTEPRSVSVSGNYAYVVHSNASGLQKFDISGNTPVLVTSVGTGGGVSIFISGNYAYVVHSGSNVLKKYNISGTLP